MNSFLNQLPFDPGFFIIGLFLILLVIIIVLLISLNKTNKKLDDMKRRYEIFMSGKDAESLEEVIGKTLKEVDRLGKNQKFQKNELGKLDYRVKKSYQKIGLIKYNGFVGMGGKASFALTLLDESNNGFILNAIHSREGCYPYIKEITDGKSDVALGREEQNSLEMALRNI